MKILKMKSIWTVLNALLFLSFTSFNSASRTASSLLAVASASSASYSNANGNSSRPKHSSSSSSPHFYFLVEPKSLDKLNENFKNLPQNFHIVVRYKLVSKSKNRKHIIKFQKRCNRNVAILLPSIRAYRLIDAEDPAKKSKLLKGVHKYFSEIIFPEYIDPSPELSLYLEDQEITNIKISEYFGKFSFVKWEARMEYSEFEGNILFKWNYSSTRKFKRIGRFLAKMKVKKKEKPNLQFIYHVNHLLRSGLWASIFSKMENKDLVRAFFKERAANLINLNGPNSGTDDRLILKRKKL